MRKINVTERRAYWCFHNQKFAAKRRGIEFLLTFEEWESWWVDQLGPDWEAQRGIYNNQYCMARIGDKGPYAIGNIKCITNKENNDEREVNGKTNPGVKNGRAKLTEADVRAIRESSETQVALSAKYGVARYVIQGILSGKTWRSVL